jgi:hypothetical protein
MPRAGTLLICSFILLTGPVPAPAQSQPAPELQTSILETARENALRYTRSLPDFLCTQTVTRFSGRDEGSLKIEDTLEISVGYTAKGEQYKLEKINGRATTRSLAGVGGVRGHGEFGTLLRDIFLPESAAVFHWLRRESLGGTSTHVYSFEIPQDHSTYRINWATAKKQYHMIAALHGLVFVSADNQQVIRIVMEADGIPRNWPVKRVYGSLDYGFFDIAGTKFLLPRRVESNVVLKSETQPNVSVFGRYRRFTGDASISF